jgi:hypothetical protein
MFESIDLFTFILILLFVAIIVAIVNFIIGVIITIRMASLKGLTEKKKPAILINFIWSIVLLVTGFSPWTYIIAFILNLTIGMIALKYDEFYGLKQFQKRLKFLLVILTVQFIISIVLYLIVFFLIVVYILGW